MTNPHSECRTHVEPSQVLKRVLSIIKTLSGDYKP